ncbi:MAG TPA: DUF5522 domain-containing protein [Acidimicrobiales bacterium]|nr:DUF5522 domain-containing protein [Acidimicrobiales bacterium]
MHDAERSDHHPPPPHRDRLDPARSDYRAILEAHAAAVRNGEPGYSDPQTGLFVLTVATLAARGTCCGSGCRHCPYLDRID